MLQSNQHIVQYQLSRYIRLASWQRESSAVAYHEMTGETFLISQLACSILAQLVPGPALLSEICQFVSNQLDTPHDPALEHEVTQLLQSLYQIGLLKRQLL